MKESRKTTLISLSEILRKPVCQMLFKPAVYFRSSLFLPSYHRAGAGACGIADTAVLVLSDW